MAMSVGQGGYASEINVTPLVDVVLVLLIIFMVIVPVLMRGYDVDVPGETTAAISPQQPRVEQIVLQIDLATCPAVKPPSSPGLPADCTVQLNDEPVRVTELAGRLRDTFAEREPAQRVLFLAAHERLNYEGVMRILDVARSSVGGLRIGLVTEAALDP